MSDETMPVVEEILPDEPESEPELAPEPLSEEIPVPITDETVYKKDNLVAKAEIMAKLQYGDSAKGKEDFKGWVEKVAGCKFPLRLNNRGELKQIINYLNVLAHAPKPQIIGGYSGGATPPAMKADTLGYFEDYFIKPVAETETLADGSRITNLKDKRVKVSTYGSQITLAEAETLVAEAKKNGQPIPKWHPYREDPTGKRPLEFMATVVHTHRGTRRFLLPIKVYPNLSDKGA